MGATRMVWAMTIAVGVKRMPKAPRGPARDSSRYTSNPTTTLGSPSKALSTTISVLPPREAADRDYRTERQADRGTGDCRGERELERERDDSQQRRVAPGNEVERDSPACKNFKHLVILSSS